jgi:hypothetical protein
MNIIEAKNDVMSNRVIFCTGFHFWGE